MVRRAALAGYVRHAVHAFELAPRDRVLQIAPLSFDTSAEEIFPCLVSGATLVLRSEEMLGSAATFLGACERAGISVQDLPTPTGTSSSPARCDCPPASGSSS